MAKESQISSYSTWCILVFLFLSFLFLGIVIWFINPKFLLFNLFFRFSVPVLSYILHLLGFLLISKVSINVSFFLLLLSMKSFFGIVSFLVTIVTSFVSIILVNMDFNVFWFNHFVCLQRVAYFAKFFFKKYTFV